MRQHKLRLEDLTVESFNTTRGDRQRGTVKGNEAEEEGTFLSWCNTCDDTCEGFTCEYNKSCAPQFTCVDNQTCMGDLTCDPDRCGGGASGLC
jgi:hypothetical protein